MSRLLVLWIAAALSLSATVATGATVTTVSARAEFIRREQGTFLRVPARRRDFDVYWAVDHPAPGERSVYPFVIRAGETYTFTVEDDPRSLYNGPHLARVVKDSRTIFDQEVCEVHHRKMDRRQARIVYGIAVNPPHAGFTPTQEARWCPHHREIIYAGCVDDGKQTDRIFVCPNCVAVFQKREAHGKAR